MVDVASISVLVIGILIGGTMAGVVAHALSFGLAATKRYDQLILFGYIAVLTVGVASEYGHPLVVAVTSYLSIVVIAGRIFDRLKDTFALKPATQRG